jgi:prepilin-type N-terminal cleavage/methylation domain-containing protein
LCLCHASSVPAPQPQAGFTLLEMSVVLAIIALVIGSVLVGSDLIAIAGMPRQLRGDIVTQS